MNFFKFVKSAFGKSKPAQKPINNFTQSSTLELKELLNSGSIHFAFKKKDGTLRVAHGTTNLNMIPRNDRPQGIKAASTKQVPFYDLEAKAWRSMSAGVECYVY